MAEHWAQQGLNVDGLVTDFEKSIQSIEASIHFFKIVLPTTDLVIELSRDDK